MFAALDFMDFLWIALMFCVFTGGSSALVFRKADRARLRRVEVKLDQIMTHLGLEVPSTAEAAQVSADVAKLMDEGKKIEAIKLHREQTGAGLAEAKQAVEAYEAAS